MTVTHAGTDVWSTHFKKVRKQSSNGEFTDICDGLVHCCTKQQKTDELVTVVDKAWNRARQCQLVCWRLLCYWCSWITLVKVFNYDDLQCSANVHSK